MGRVTRNLPVVRVGPDRVVRRTDTLAVEEPLEIRLDNQAFQVTMRTPGEDIDLIHGLLHAESVITGRADVVAARYCAGTGPDGLNTYNVVNVTLAAGVVAPEPRKVVTSSACGICGTVSIEEVTRASRFPLDPDLRVPADLIRRAPDLLRSQQRAFERTGGLHAAGLIDLAGRLVCAREDVGRHNAVDKVIGWALRQDLLPLSRHVLVVSGRASFELTQKAVLAGIPVLAAVSAPSSLAAELAEDAGLTLAGFVRGESMNIYAHPERLLDSVP